MTLQTSPSSLFIFEYADAATLREGYWFITIRR
jgi:hypothetical protein